MPILNNSSKSHFSFHPIVLFILFHPGEDTLKEVHSARISCPKGSMAYGSYCYALFRIPQTWFDAEVSTER